MHASPAKANSWAHKNPFRSKRIEQLSYEFCSGSRALLLEKLESCNYRGAIVGQHGSGKTTLLEQLVPDLEKRGKTCRILKGYRKPSLDISWSSFGPSRAEILLVDGYDLLSSKSKLLLNIRALASKGVIVTAHRTPRIIPMLHRCETSPELLVKLLYQLQPNANWDRNSCAELLTAHQGNLREIFGHLYDSH